MGLFDFLKKKPAADQNQQDSVQPNVTNSMPPVPEPMTPPATQPVGTPEGLSTTPEPEKTPMPETPTMGHPG